MEDEEIVMTEEMEKEFTNTFKIIKENFAIIKKGKKIFHRLILK